MSRIALVTNSVAAIPADLIARYQITLVPMQIHFLNGSYEEERDISLAEFYERLAHEEVIPSTSPPSIRRYTEVFRSLAATHDTILSVHMSSTLTKSFRNAQLAAQQFEGAQVLVHDSGSVALGAGFQVLAAARMIEQRASAEAIMAELQRLRERTRVLFTPASLRFMRNSQQIGPISALIATWLNIKPIVSFHNGRIALIDRCRSFAAALDRQRAELARLLGGDRPAAIGVCHANAPDVAATLAEQIRAQFARAHIYTSDMGAVLAIHVGPGTIGLIGHPYEE